jgi:protein-S-isoprenylcysteine O-methyltransferase Ste14
MTAVLETAQSTSPHRRRAQGRRARLGWLVTTTAFVSVSSLFAFAHWQYWRRTGDPKGVSFALEELVVVAVALARRRPSDVSYRVSDWFAALLGTFSALMLRPGSEAVLGLDGLWLAMQLLGAAGAIICLARLGRRFGVVAADRGVQHAGPYRVVRHPLYASYFVAMTGYLLAAPTLWNAAVCLVAVGAQLRRITAEECVLARNEAYRSYMSAVRWRLVPGVF